VSTTPGQLHWWLDPATVCALSSTLIAAVYIGFAVADGRPRVIAVESVVAGAFVVLAAAGVTGPAWLLVVGLTGHGFKDLWQHRSHFVANTCWWPPFCLVVDWVAAAVLVVLITVGVPFPPSQASPTADGPNHPLARWRGHSGRAASRKGVRLFPAIRPLPGVPVERLLEGPHEQLGCC
jgi:hypothetical protein